MFLASSLFWKGYSRVFDLFASQRNLPDYSRGMHKDFEALKGDWVKVGDDLRSGARQYHNEIESTRY